MPHGCQSPTTVPPALHPFLFVPRPLQSWAFSSGCHLWPQPPCLGLAAQSQPWPWLSQPSYTIAWCRAQNPEYPRYLVMGLLSIPTATNWYSGFYHPTIIPPSPVTMECLSAGSHSIRLSSTQLWPSWTYSVATVSSLYQKLSLYLLGLLLFQSYDPLTSYRYLPSA